MERLGIGQAVQRFEDPRLLRGEGRFVSDRVLPGEAYLAIVRSPHANARIASVDRQAALAAGGVLGVFTVEDLLADGVGTTTVGIKRSHPDGKPMFWQAHPGLAKDRVRHVGDPVVAVVADTAARAKDAAEQVIVDYEPLEPSAPVWDECPDNVCNAFEIGDRAATERALAGAARVVKRRYVAQRVHAQYLEPRATIGAWDAAAGRYVLYADVQYPHRLREVLAQCFGVPENRVRVVCEDIGGAFGAKGFAHLEHRLVLWLARKLGRPVKWVCERSEAPLADDHGRDLVSEAELALDASGKFLGLRVHNLNNVGAYVSSDRQLLPSSSNLGSLVGVYAFPAAHVRVTCTYSNSSAIAPYRGNGRPEAIYVLERLVDDAARELGLDRVELRRKNLVPASSMPYRTALTFTYDCGEFERGMDAALEAADWKGFEARRADSKSRGKLRGIGIANPIERAASPPAMEYCEVRFDPGGAATVLVGTKASGQGHETMYRQIACDRLGLDPADVRVLDGDTDTVGFGGGSFGSRSAALGGTALHLASEKIVAKGKRIAAHLLEANEADVGFAQGRFSISGTDRGIAMKDVAQAAFVPAKLPKGMEAGFFEHATFVPSAETFPNGTHVCEVEVDPETGAVEVLRYTVVDDVGNEINPLTLKGQIVGGVAQGLGQVLMERIVYDETGQLLTGSFMDYAMPRAADLCGVYVGSNPVPTKMNPLGVKGAGEAGTVGALAAAMNAVSDALGGAEIDMPVTPEKVWRAIKQP